MARSIRRISLLALTVAALLLPVPASAQNGTLSLQKIATFDKGLKLPDAIRTDCRLETKLIDFIESFAKDDFNRVAMVEDASAVTSGRALAVSITGLSCEGGGAWSGPKHLTIRGTLRQDGRVIGTFTAHRVTVGGVLGAYRGTCSLLGRCARALGKDVAGWLRNPAMDAVLGDAVALPPPGAQSGPTGTARPEQGTTDK